MPSTSTQRGSSTSTSSPAPNRSIDELDSALARIDAIVQRIGEREPVFFLDFDGTLAPIVDQPEQAEIPEESRKLLEDLAARRRVAIVSGRDLDDLRGRVALDDVYYAGSHGFRLAGPGGLQREHPDAARFLPALDRAEAVLRDRVAGLEGVQIERKRYAIAAHSRQASEEAESELRRIVEEMEKNEEGLQKTEGRKVIELRPAIEWDKGRAVEWLLESFDLDGGENGTSARGFPIYIGDDVTDEDAFRVVAEQGAAIVVRGRAGSTSAQAALSDPWEVPRFLQSLDEELRRP